MKKKNSWQVTVALAFVAQAFRKEPEAFEVFEELSLGAICQTEPVVYMLAEHFDIKNKSELRERFYRTFYPNEADMVLALNVEVTPKAN